MAGPRDGHGRGRRGRARVDPHDPGLSAQRCRPPRRGRPAASRCRAPCRERQRPARRGVGAHPPRPAFVLRREHDQARNDLTRAQRLAEEAGWLSFAPYPLAWLAEVALLDGRLAEAADLFGHAHALALEIADPCWETLACRGLGLVTAANGDEAEAARLLYEAPTACQRFTDTSAAAWVALLTLWSIDRYGKIELTRARLRVGRDTLPTSQVDLVDLLLQARSDEGAARRWRHVLDGVDLPAERIVGQAPLLGGAYGSVFGSQVLVIRLADASWGAIDVKRPAELLDALLRARTGQEPRTM